MSFPKVLTCFCPLDPFLPKPVNSLHFPQISSEVLTKTNQYLIFRVATLPQKKYGEKNKILWEIEKNMGKIWEML